MRTSQSKETGKTGGGPSHRTQPRSRNEKDPCPWSETGVPAPKSESPGRYEQEGRPPPVFDLDILSNKKSMGASWCE